MEITKVTTILRLLFYSHLSVNQNTSGTTSHSVPKQNSFDKQRNCTANISFSYARALSNRLSARQSLPARGGFALTWRASCSPAVLGAAEGSALTRRASPGPGGPTPARSSPAFKSPAGPGRNAFLHESSPGPSLV